MLECNIAVIPSLTSCTIEVPVLQHEPIILADATFCLISSLALIMSYLAHVIEVEHVLAASVSRGHARTVAYVRHVVPLVYHEHLVSVVHEAQVFHPAEIERNRSGND